MPELSQLDLQTVILVFVTFSVGNEQLLGQSQADSARVQQWINFGDNEILPASCTWVFPCLGITQFNKQVFFL